MNKFNGLFLAGIMVLGLTACGNSENVSQKEDANNVTINSLNGAKEQISLNVEYDPQRLAVLDMAALDILDSLGVGNRVVGTADTSLEYLQEYVNNDDVINLGTIKEADMEAVMKSDPDVIFIGGRLASVYDELSEIAPVVYLAVDTDTGVVESVRKNAETIASLFGLQAKVEDCMSGYDERISKLNEFANGKEAVIGICTSGGFNVLGNDGRCSIIGREIGFNNIGIEQTQTTSTHGNESSFELIVEKSPEYMFVLDRDAATEKGGAKLAKDIVENQLVKSTDVYKNGNIIYLENAAAWYTAEGGIQALDLMLDDLEVIIS